MPSTKTIKKEFAFFVVAVEQTHLDAEAGGSGHPEEFACCTAAPCLCMILFSLFSLSVTCLLFRLEVSATSQTKLSLCLGVCLQLFFSFFKNYIFIANLQ